ncbi:MAG: YncE family protein [Solirubrobacterales bacterium]
MSLLFICNTSSDCVSKVDPENFREINRIDLKGFEDKKIGPHGICKYRSSIITANSYSNTVSIISLEDSKVFHKFIGMHCNDVTVLDRRAFVICGDLNNVMVLDLFGMNVIEVIPCGSQPHSICSNKKNKLILTSNFNNDSITLIDVMNKTNVDIRVGAYPTKVLFTLDGKSAIVCESNMGSDYKGCISIICLKTLSIIQRIAVGMFPSDIYCDEKYIYVSNFGEGTVSIIDVNNYREIEKIIVGGMPRGIISNGKNLYIGDYYNNLLINFNYETKIKRKIPVGNEPAGMVLI